MSTTTDLAIPLRPCTPWCEDGPAAHADQHPDDRSCWSTYNVVPLTRHKPMRMGDGGWMQAWLNVYLRRFPMETTPSVFIHSEETDNELRLTLPEAKQLLGVLQQLIELGDTP